MDGDNDEKIQARAYEIWEREGRPHGRHHEHWHQAAEEHGSDAHPGMMGDGTEEQNLNQKGNPEARITEGEVKAAFAGKPSK